MATGSAHRAGNCRFDPVTATAFDDRVNDRAAFSGIGVTEKEPVLFAQSGWADCIFNEISIDLDLGFFEIDLQGLPLSQRVVEGFAHRTLWQEASAKVPALQDPLDSGADKAALAGPVRIAQGTAGPLAP